MVALGYDWGGASISSILVFEWIRRKDPIFDKELRDFLITDTPITHG